MQISNDKLKKLAAMSDEEFKKFISEVASESGVVIPSISAADVSGIRSLLGGVTSGDPTLTKAVDDISKSIDSAPNRGKKRN